MGMKIGAVSLGWKGIALPDVFAQVRDAGGECVELNSKPGLHDDLVLDPQTCGQVRAWAKDAGLTISAVSGYNDFALCDRELLRVEIERLVHACRIASELKVGVVRAFVGSDKPGESFAKFRPYVIESFQEAGRQAASLGVALAIENHGYLLNDGPALAQLLKDIDADNVGVTLDTGNFSWAGHGFTQTWADFEAVLPYVFNVHIKDGVWHGDEFEFVPAGEGALNVRKVLTRLAELEYEGAVCSEYEGSGNFLEGTRASIAYLCESRQRLLGHD